MARYTVAVSYVDVIGPIWWPYGAVCAQRKDLSGYDLENIRARREGRNWREAVEDWLGCNAGDFQHVQDFSASLELDGTTIDIPWADEESKFTFSDCMYGEEG